MSIFWCISITMWHTLNMTFYMAWDCVVYWYISQIKLIICTRINIVNIIITDPVTPFHWALDSGTMVVVPMMLLARLVIHNFATFGALKNLILYINIYIQVWCNIPNSLLVHSKSEKAYFTLLPTNLMGPFGLPIFPLVPTLPLPVVAFFFLI